LYIVHYNLSPGDYHQSVCASVWCNCCCFEVELYI